MESAILVILLLIAYLTNSAWLSLTVFTLTVISITRDYMKYKQAKQEDNSLKIVLYKDKPEEEVK